MAEEKVLITDAALGDARSLMALFKKYRPIINKLRRQYFIKDFDVDDWDQEGLIVLYRTCKKFNHARTVSFGSFFQLSMRNQVFDLIRRSQAKKRQPTSEVVSLSAQETDYAETLRSPELMPEEVVLMRELLYGLRRYCSDFEVLIFDLLIEGRSPRQIAFTVGMELNQVVNAIDRCKRKMIKIIQNLQVNGDF